MRTPDHHHLEQIVKVLAHYCHDNKSINDYYLSNRQDIMHIALGDIEGVKKKTVGLN
jgi:hypothetical protein